MKFGNFISFPFSLTYTVLCKGMHRSLMFTVPAKYTQAYSHGTKFWLGVINSMLCGELVGSLPVILLTCTYIWRSVLSECTVFALIRHWFSRECDFVSFSHVITNFVRWANNRAFNTFTRVCLHFRIKQWFMSVKCK